MSDEVLAGIAESTGLDSEQIEALKKGFDGFDKVKITGLAFFLFMCCCMALNKSGRVSEGLDLVDFITSPIFTCDISNSYGGL